MSNEKTEIGMVNPCDYDKVVKKLRIFFTQKNFIEVHVQSRLSILAACEDPTTIATFNYSGQVWPLPQTGQMWLEHELLKSPKTPGFFCVSTSYRNEPNPNPERHEKIFPMVEFEFKGDIEDLISFEKELCEYLEFPTNGSDEKYPRGKYKDVAKFYKVTELAHNHEGFLKDDYDCVFFLTDFPNYTSPFWNMAQVKKEDCAKKVDVIINGVETIGSAERSSDPDEMRRRFDTISNGMYAKTLYAGFTKNELKRNSRTF